MQIERERPRHSPDGVVANAVHNRREFSARMKSGRLSHRHWRGAGLWSALVLTLAVAGCRAPRTAHGNEPPLGSLESPAEGARVAALTLRGWAGDDRGIRSVQVRVDGTLASLGAFDWERDDVLLYYPAFEHGNRRLGWFARVPGLPPGPHVVDVTLVDITGLTRDIGRLNIFIEPEQSGSPP